MIDKNVENKFSWNSRFQFLPWSVLKAVDFFVYQRFDWRMYFAMASLHGNELFDLWIVRTPLSQINFFGIMFSSVMLDGWKCNSLFWKRPREPVKFQLRSEWGSEWGLGGSTPYLTIFQPYYIKESLECVYVFRCCEADFPQLFCLMLHQYL